MVKRKWQLNEAKNRLTDVVRRAQSEGPQVITLHGAEVAVVVSIDGFNKLSRRENGLVEFFRNSPLVGVNLQVKRRRKLAGSKTRRRQTFAR